MRKLTGLLMASMIFFSCGGSLQSTDSAPEIPANASQFERNGLVFDPFAQEPDSPLGIPFPNDIIWTSSETKADEENYVYLDPSTTEDPGTRALYEAINQLKIKGLSPNTPILIPLMDSIQLDMESLNGNLKIFDLTALALCPSDNTFCSLIDQTDRLEVIQERNYLKLYPIKPLEAGHRYAVVLINGIKDVNGNPILPPQAYNKLEEDGKLDELYGALSKIDPNLNKDTILEAFTFTTADKTLSVFDLGAIKSYLEALSQGENTTLTISGISYSEIENDYRNFDSENTTLSPLYGVFKLIANNSNLKALISTGKFPAFDITKLSELLTKVKLEEPFDIDDYVKFIPVYFGNRDLYNGTVYIFQHGLGGSKERVEALLQDIQLPVIAIDLPFHGNYTKLTENSTFECGEGKCFLTSNVAQDRLNIYQSVFNLRLLELLLRNGFYDLNGDGNPDSANTVNFLGISMGSIVGSIYANYGTPDKVVLNVGGANFVSITDRATNQLIESLLESTGAKKNTNKYCMLLGIFQLILDPADPLYIGETKSDRTIIQTAYNDTVVPNVSNEALAKKVGFDSYQSIELPDPDNPPADLPGWYMFGGGENWVNHAFLLHTEVENYPEAEGHLDVEFLQKAQKAAREQINNFFNQ
ncbi:Ig-like domain-containing domain [Desulfurobacterium crinifex]